MWISPRFVWSATLAALSWFCSAGEAPQSVRESVHVSGPARLALPFSLTAILKQSGGTLPDMWGTYAGKSIPAWYGMSLPSDRDSNYLHALETAFDSLPAVLIEISPENLFSQQRGIYLHPMERGREWERPVRVSVVAGPTRTAGRGRLRIHGGMSRRPEESPKHSFRLGLDDFHGAEDEGGREPAGQGPSKPQDHAVRWPLSSLGFTNRINDFVLRSGGSDSWLDSDGQLRWRALYIRDEWMRRTMREMGYRAVEGVYAHLFLNGLYWGIYNLCEDPVASAQDGGSRRCDLIKDGKLQSGERAAWDRLMELAASGVDDANYARVSELLDTTQFADYVILNLYAGNSDWAGSENWYAVRPRVPGGKFQFHVWDAERTFGDCDLDALRNADDQSPLGLFQKLCLNSAFRSVLTSRLNHLCSGNGPFTTARAAARMRALAEEVEKALPAEAARWGTYRQQVHPFKTGPYEAYSVPAHWRKELERVVASCIPSRGKSVIGQLTQHGFLPKETVNAVAE